MKSLIAIRTSKTTYKFINVKKHLETLGEVATVVMFMAAIWLMMFI